MTRHAFDLQFSILAILLSDPRLLGATDLQAEDFTDPACRELYECVSAHKTNSMDVIGAVCGADMVTIAKNICQNWCGGASNLSRHVQGLRRARAVDEYARVVKEKLGGRK